MIFSYILCLLFLSWGIQDVGEEIGKASATNGKYTFARIIPVEDHYSMLLQYLQDGDDESQFMIIALQAEEIQEREFFDPRQQWNLEEALQVRGTSAFHYYDISNKRMYIFYTNKDNELHVSFDEGEKHKIPSMKKKKGDRILITDAPKVINGYFFLVLEKKQKKKKSRTYLLRSIDFLENPGEATWESLPSRGIRSRSGVTEDAVRAARNNPAKTVWSNTNWDPSPKTTSCPSLLQLNDSRIVVAWKTEIGILGRTYGDNLGESFTDSDWIRFAGTDSPVQLEPFEYNGRMITPPIIFKKLDGHLLRHRGGRTGLTKLRDGTFVMVLRNTHRPEVGKRFIWLYVGEVKVDEVEGHLLRFFQPELLFKSELGDSKKKREPMFDFVEVGEKLFLLEADGLLRVHEVDRSLIEIIKTQDSITEISNEKLVHDKENPRIGGLIKGEGFSPSKEFTVAMWLRASNYGGKHREFCGHPWDEELARKNRCMPSVITGEKVLFLTLPGSKGSGSEAKTAKIEFEAYQFGVLIHIYIGRNNVIHLSTMCGDLVTLWNQKHHMVAFVYDGDMLRVSIDDVLCDGDSEKKQGWLKVDNDFRIGSQFRREPNYAGGFDRFVMYHRALRHTEVIGLWRQSTTREWYVTKPIYNMPWKKKASEKPSSKRTQKDNTERTVKAKSSSEPQAKTEL